MTRDHHVTPQCQPSWEIDVLKRFLLPLAALLSVLTAACAPAPVTPLSADARKSIQGITADVSGRKIVDMSTVGARGSSEGAARGAGEVVGSSGPVAAVGDPKLVVLLPIATVMGSIVGAISAKSPEQVDAARAALSSALQRTDFTQLLNTAIARSGRAAGSVSLTVSNSSAAGEPAVLGEKSRRMAVSYKLSHFSFGAVTPILQVYVEATAVVYASDQKTALHTNTWAYCGKRHDFMALAANDGALMVAELSQAATVLGKAIVYDTFQASSGRSLEKFPACMSFSDLPDDPVAGESDPSTGGSASAPGATAR
jgi:hypothetical protein